MYKLYLYYKDIRISKWNTIGDDWEEVYNEYSKDLIVKGFRGGVNMKSQIKTSKLFLDLLHERKVNCEKIKASDLIIAMSCYFLLVKFKEIDTDNFLFLKKKKNSQG